MTEQAINIKDSEEARIARKRRAGDDDDIENDVAQLSSMVRAEFVISRLNVLMNSCNMTTFSDINRKMFKYIFSCRSVYLLAIVIFFTYNNCGECNIYVF